jgi:phage repressor protein C with HTH and peptisase S24 domain
MSHAPIAISEQIIFHRMRGDSMSPALLDGDIAVIDTSDTYISEPGIFACTDGVGVTIYKTELVRYSRPTLVRCTPINSRYDAFEATLDDEVKILGRVRRKITQI